MERRREPRLWADLPVTVTRLDEPVAPVKAVVVDVSAEGIGLMAAAAIPSHTPVRVDWEGGLLLGEIVHAGREGSAFLLGIAVQHCLADLAALAHACAAFAG